MVYAMKVAMSIDCMATQMHIGSEVSQTEEAHQVDVFFVWVYYDFMV